MIVEAEKSHDLLPANQRTKKASGVIQFECEGLRLRGQWYKSQSESEGPRTRGIYIREQKMDATAQAKRISLPFLGQFVPSKPSRHGMISIHIGQDNR